MTAALGQVYDCNKCQAYMLWPNFAKVFSGDMVITVMRRNAGDQVRIRWRPVSGDYANLGGPASTSVHFLAHADTPPPVPPTAGPNSSQQGSGPLPQQFKAIVVGNDTFSLCVDRASQRVIHNEVRCRVTDTNKGWEVLKIMWPPIDGKGVEGKDIRKQLDIDASGNPKQWAASNAASVRAVLVEIPALSFRVRASSSKLIWEQLADGT